MRSDRVNHVSAVCPSSNMPHALLHTPDVASGARHLHQPTVATHLACKLLSESTGLFANRAPELAHAGVAQSYTACGRQFAAIGRCAMGRGAWGRIPARRYACIPPRAWRRGICSTAFRGTGRERSVNSAGIV